MRLQSVHFPLVSGAHGAAGAIHRGTDIHTRLPLVLHELPKTRLEDPLHAARSMTRGCCSLKKRIEIRSFPENILEFIALLHCLADDEQFAEDEPPRHQR